ITIKDEIFNNGASKYFSKPISGSFSAIPTAVTPTYDSQQISWTFTPTSVEETLKYSITVQ
ncbi:MAG: hypothetical protein Athens101428_313, partial [Candidatus Berkelbacteria bacterium Athens1014_28]